jgi:hypothetical protein
MERKAARFVLPLSPLSLSLSPKMSELRGEEGKYSYLTSPLQNAVPVTLLYYARLERDGK